MMEHPNEEAQLLMPREERSDGPSTTEKPTTKLTRKGSVKNLINVFEDKASEHPRWGKRSKSLGEGLKRTNSTVRSARSQNNILTEEDEMYVQLMEKSIKTQQDTYVKLKIIDDVQEELQAVELEFDQDDPQLLLPLQNKIISLLFKIGMVDSEGIEEVKAIKRIALKNIQRLYVKLVERLPSSWDEEDENNNGVESNTGVENNEGGENRLPVNLKSTYRSAEDLRKIEESRKAYESRKGNRQNPAINRYHSFAGSKSNDLVHHNPRKQTSRPYVKRTNAVEEVSSDSDNAEVSRAPEISHVDSSGTSETKPRSFIPKVQSLRQKFEALSKDNKVEENTLEQKVKPSKANYSMTWVQQPGQIPRRQLSVFGATVSGNQSNIEKNDLDRISSSSSDEDGEGEVKDQNQQQMVEAVSKTQLSEHEDVVDNNKVFVHPKDIKNVRVNKLKELFEWPNVEPVFKTYESTRKITRSSRPVFTPRQDHVSQEEITCSQETNSSQETIEVTNSQIEVTNSQIEVTNSQIKLVASEEKPPQEQLCRAHENGDEMPKVSQLKSRFEQLAKTPKPVEIKSSQPKPQSKPINQQYIRYFTSTKTSSGDESDDEYQYELNNYGSSEDHHYDISNSSDSEESDRSTIVSNSSEVLLGVRTKEESHEEFPPTRTPQNTECEGTEDEERDYSPLNNTNASSTEYEEDFGSVTLRQKRSVETKDEKINLNTTSTCECVYNEETHELVPNIEVNGLSFRCGTKVPGEEQVSAEEQNLGEEETSEVQKKFDLGITLTVSMNEEALEAFERLSNSVNLDDEFEKLYTASSTDEDAAELNEKIMEYKKQLVGAEEINELKEENELTKVPELKVEQEAPKKEDNVNKTVKAPLIANVDGLTSLINIAKALQNMGNIRKAEVPTSSQELTNGEEEEFEETKF